MFLKINCHPFQARVHNMHHQSFLRDANHFYHSQILCVDQVKFEQGTGMLNIFKSFSSKTSILDDFQFYENRQRALTEKRARQQVQQQREQQRQVHPIHCPVNCSQCHLVLTITQSMHDMDRVINKRADTVVGNVMFVSMLFYVSGSCSLNRFRRESREGGPFNSKRCQICINIMLIVTCSSPDVLGCAIAGRWMDRRQ